MSPLSAIPSRPSCRARHLALPAWCLAGLAACSSPALEQRAQADHAQAAVGPEALLSGAPLARQAALASPLQASAPVGEPPPSVAGGATAADARARDQAAAPVLRRAARPWIGTVSVPMGAGESLPSIFTEPVRLQFDDAATGGKVSLRTVAERITMVTGVPVRLKADVFTGQEAAPRTAPVGGGSSGGPSTALATGASPVPLPVLQAAPGGAGAMPAAPGAPGVPLPTVAGPVLPRDTSVHAVAMRWTGPLEGYLNQITDQLNLAWDYRDGVVVIERLRTEFFEVAALDGETDYKMGLGGADQAVGGATSASGGGGNSSSASASNDVAEHGKGNAVASILAAVQQIIKDVPGSSAVRSEGSGRLAVTTSKETLSRVREFIRAENQSLLRQAQIQFDVYAVTRHENDERGIEWSALLGALGGGWTGSFGSPATLVSTTAGNIGLNILTPAPGASGNLLQQRWGGSSALLKLLSGYGISTQHRQVSLLALNRTWDRKSSLGGRAYVSATVPGAATAAGVGAPGLVTSTVTTGDRYLAQPFILDNNTVLLKFGIGLSSLVSLVNFTSGTGLAQQTVQTPETTAINDQATVALKAGQILVITGLSRSVTTDDRRSLADGAPIGLGGAKTVSRLREDFVIFVRPVLL